MMIKCPECGRQVSDAAPTCPGCGVKIAGNIKQCPNCGEIIFNNVDMCPNCHQSVIKAGQQVQTVQPKTNTYTAPQQPVAEPATTTNEVQPENQEPEKKKNNHVGIIVTLVVILIIALVGYYMYGNSQKQKEIDAYEHAYQSSDPTVLNDYLTLYGDKAPEEHVDSIQAHLDRLKAVDLDWTNALMSNNKTALQDYIQKHPGSKHETEAKQKIDSLDWVEVTAAATTDAYQRYIDEHGTDGAHYDEAMQQVEKMNNMKVTPEDKEMVSSLFHQYFSSLGSKDESNLLTTLNSVMDNFLGKRNATKSDVINFMHKIFQSDIQSMTFTPNNDFKIEKQEVGDEEYSFSVAFSVDQRINRNDASKENFCTCKVRAKVTPEGKITEMNMTKILQ